MSTEKPKIEFWYGLGCEPVLIGAGSSEDFDRAYKEGAALDAASKTAPGSVMSAGTRHVLREFARLAGVEPTTAEALSLYDNTVRRGREAFLQTVTNPDEPIPSIKNTLDHGLLQAPESPEA